MDKLFIDFQALKFINEFSKIFISWSSDPLISIFQQIKHDFCQKIFFFFFGAQFSHIDDDFNTSFSNGPVWRINWFAMIKGKQSWEKLFWYKLTDDRKMNNGLFSYFKAGVLSQR